MEYNMSFPRELNAVKENRIPTVICGVLSKSTFASASEILCQSVNLIPLM